MRKELFDFIDPNGRSAKGVLWECDGTPKGILQISHGMSEHIHRYEPLASYMCDNGWAVIGSDQPGHGLDTPEEDLGYFGEGGYEGAIQRLHQVTLWAKQRFPAVPVVLLGHSMGSFMARGYLTRYGDEISAAVIMGTAGPNPAAGAGLLLVNLLTLFKGKRAKSPLVEKMMFGNSNQRFAEDSAHAWLSANPENVSLYEGDDRCGFAFPLDGYKALLSVLREVSSKKWAGKVPKDLPILMVSGGDDPVGDFGKGVSLVAQRLRQAGVKDVDLRLYQGARHEILNETIKDRVMKDILTFAEKKGGSINEATAGH